LRAFRAVDRRPRASTVGRAAADARRRRSVTTSARTW
jgi:hypothetical protein